MPSNKIVTTQRTAKRYKGTLALSVLGMVLGGIYLWISVANGGGFSPVAVVILGLSLLGFIYAKLGAWWNNG